MSKAFRCLSCSSRPNLVLEKGERPKRREGTGWTMVCPVCGSVSPERGTTKKRTIAAWNEANSPE